MEYATARKINHTRRSSMVYEDVLYSHNHGHDVIKDRDIMLGAMFVIVSL